MGAVRALLAGLTDSRLFEDVVELDDREPLGSGRFGRVVSGVWKPTGERVAIKVPVSADFSKMGEHAVRMSAPVAAPERRSRRRSDRASRAGSHRLRSFR